MARVNVNRRLNIYVNGVEVQNNIKDIQGAYYKLRNQIRRGISDQGEYNRKVRELRRLKSVLDDHQNDLRGVNKQWEMFKTIFLGTLGSNLAANFLQRAVSFIPNMVRGLGKVSDELADIQKVTNASEDSVKALNKELGEIETRTSRSDLRKIAVEGGRLNIPIDELKQFVEEADKAGVALGDDFSGGAQEASASLGKMVSLFKETREADISTAVSRSGSAINELGANTKASAGPIANYAKRVGNLPDAFKPAIQDALGLGAAFDESGLEAENAARAYGIFIGEATERVSKFAQVMGVSREEAEKLINEDPVEFFLQFSEALNGMNATEVSETLKDLGLGANEVKKIVGAASGNIDRFREILELSNVAFAENTSLAAENAIKQETLQAKLDKLQKRLHSIFTAPILQEGAEWFVDFLDRSLNWIERNTQAIKVIGQVLLVGASALGTYRLAMALSNKESRLFLSIQNLLNTRLRLSKSLLLLLTAAQARFTGNTHKATVAMRAFNMTTKANPIGLLISLVTAAATAFFLFRKEVDETAKVTARLNDIRKQHEDRLVEEKTKVEALFEAVKKTNNGSEQRAALIDEINDKYGTTLKNIQNESRFLADLALAQDKVIANLEILAKRSALTDVLTEQQKAIVETEREIDRLIAKVSSGKSMEELTWWEQFKAGTNLVFPGVLDTASERVMDRIDSLRKKLVQLKLDSKSTSESLVKMMSQTAQKSGGAGGPVGGSSGKSKTASTISDTFRADMDSMINEFISSHESAFVRQFNAVQEHFNQLRAKQQEYYNLGIIDFEEYSARIKEIDFQVAVERAELVRQTQIKLQNDLLQLREDLAFINAERTMDEAQKARRAVMQQFTAMRDELNLLLEKQLEVIASSSFSDETKQKMREEILEEYRALLEEINLEEEEALEDAEEDRIIALWQKRADAIRDYASKALEFTSRIHKIMQNQEQKTLHKYEASQNRQLRALEARHEAGKISEAEYNAERFKIEQEFENKKREIAKRQWIREQTMQIASAIVNTLSAATQALPNLFLAGLITAIGMANVAAIATTPAPQFAKGTFQVLKGPRHTEGGIRLTNNRTGEVIGDGEDGEAFMILSREATKNNMPLIEALAMSSATDGSNALKFLGKSIPKQNFFQSSEALRFERGAFIQPSSGSPVINKGTESRDPMPEILVSELGEVKTLLASIDKKMDTKMKPEWKIPLSKLREAESLMNQVEGLSRFRQ